jgi:hypothetical protein
MDSIDLLVISSDRTLVRMLSRTDYERDDEGLNTNTDVSYVHDRDIYSAIKWLRKQHYHNTIIVTGYDNIGELNGEEFLYLLTGNIGNYGPSSISGASIDDIKEQNAKIGGFIERNFENVADYRHFIECVYGTFVLITREDETYEAPVGVQIESFPRDKLDLVLEYATRSKTTEYRVDGQFPEDPTVAGEFDTATMDLNAMDTGPSGPANIGPDRSSN